MSLPSFDDWRRLSRRGKTVVAKDLARQLPQKAAFVGLAQHALGGAANEIAEFDCSGSRFRFVPAAGSSIGFDARKWSPDAEEQADWNGTADAYGLSKSLTDYLRTVLTTPRRVDIPPLLVESQANEVGWAPIELTDRRIKEFLKTVQRGGTLTLHQGNDHIRIRNLGKGKMVAEEARQLFHRDLAGELGAAGFRLPTSDEWEYLCGAGADSLFRWGNHVPCDRYPTDRRNKKKWEFHRVPNAFGFVIAYDPYRYELVAEADVVRGGDGGGANCGGAGYFAGWLPLATAYFERNVSTRNAETPLSPGFTFVRRVMELS